eukprot:COSAG06_NODE_27536_length_591_cov_1.014228_1_plen_79_part_01
MRRLASTMWSWRDGRCAQGVNDDLWTSERKCERHRDRRHIPGGMNPLVGALEIRVRGGKIQDDLAVVELPLIEEHVECV